MNKGTEQSNNTANDLCNVLATEPNAERKVALCWATKKRHIAVDGKVLCEPDHKTTGYSVKNGGYNTLTLSGLPTYEKVNDDSKYTHPDGNIPFRAMDKQPTKIDTRSICRKCLKKYEQLLAL